MQCIRSVNCAIELVAVVTLEITFARLARVITIIMLRYKILGITMRDH